MVFNTGLAPGLGFPVVLQGFPVTGTMDMQAACHFQANNVALFVIVA